MLLVLLPMDDASWRALYMNEPIEREGLLYAEDELRRYFELPDGEPDGVVSICDTKDKGKDYSFVSRFDTNYCSSHDCSNSNCPYPAKETGNSRGSYCNFHSCEIATCLQKKQQSNLPYCSSHLSHLN